MMKKILIATIFVVGLVGIYLLSCTKDKVKPIPTPKPPRMFSLLLRDSIANLYLQDGYKTIWLEMSDEMVSKGETDVYVDLETFEGNQTCGSGVWNYSEHNSHFYYSWAVKVYAISEADTNFRQRVIASIAPPWECSTGQIYY